MLSLSYIAAVVAASLAAGDLALRVRRPSAQSFTKQGRTVPIDLLTSFFRPIEKLEIVRNGQTIATASGDGKRSTLTLTAKFEDNDSCWIAAHVWAQRLPGEPEIQGHTNPVYVLKEGRPVLVRAARKALAERWRAEVDWYRKAQLIFGNDTRTREFFAEARRAQEQLNKPID